MVGMIQAIFKSKEHIEGYTFESNKQIIEVKDQYKVKIDEISSNGIINQQTITAYSENVDLIEKLNNLEMYQKAIFIVDIIYYRGQPSKVVIVDVVDVDNEKEAISNIFKKYAR